MHNDDLISVCFSPVYGLIFLFKWMPDDQPAGSLVQDSRLETIFFAKQVSNLVICEKYVLRVYLRFDNAQ